MDSKDLITRCPHCQTTFRVTEAQLLAAEGAVRCGSCLEIFAGRNHLVALMANAARGTMSPVPDGTDETMSISDEDNTLADATAATNPAEDNESIAVPAENAADPVVEAMDNLELFEELDDGEGDALDSGLARQPDDRPVENIDLNPVELKPDVGIEREPADTDADQNPIAPDQAEESGADFADPAIEDPSIADLSIEDPSIEDPSIEDPSIEEPSIADSGHQLRDGIDRFQQEQEPAPEQEPEPEPEQEPEHEQEQEQEPEEVAGPELSVGSAEFASLEDLSDDDLLADWSAAELDLLRGLSPRAAEPVHEQEPEQGLEPGHEPEPEPEPAQEPEPEPAQEPEPEPEQAKEHSAPRIDGSDDARRGEQVAVPGQDLASERAVEERKQAVLAQARDDESEEDPLQASMAHQEEPSEDPAGSIGAALEQAPADYLHKEPPGEDGPGPEREEPQPSPAQQQGVMPEGDGVGEAHEGESEDKSADKSADESTDESADGSLDESDRSELLRETYWEEAEEVTVSAAVIPADGMGLDSTTQTANSETIESLSPSVPDNTDPALQPPSDQARRHSSEEKELAHSAESAALASSDEAEAAPGHMQALDALVPGVGAGGFEIPEIEAESPVTIDEYVPSRPLQIRWLVGSICLIMTLCGQYLWYNSNQLAQNPALRSYYLGACNLLGCELSEYHRPELLRTSNLMVRQVQEPAPALSIDAILRNEAAYRQRFPDLAMNFSNLAGDPVAARQFGPHEYLAGEMTGIRTIPAGTEVRISLQIVDPGIEAINYSLEIITED